MPYILLAALLGGIAFLIAKDQGEKEKPAPNPPRVPPSGLPPLGIPPVTPAQVLSARIEQAKTSTDLVFIIQVAGEADVAGRHDDAADLRFHAMQVAGFPTSLSGVPIDSNFAAQLWQSNGWIGLPPIDQASRMLVVRDAARAQAGLPPLR